MPSISFYIRRLARVLCVAIGCSTPALCQAQSSIRVFAKDTGQPLAYAHVLITGDKPQTVVTDESGAVSVNLTKPFMLQVSYVGYVTYTGTVAPEAQVNVMLEPDQFNLSEVVVTGEYTPTTVNKSLYQAKVLDQQHIQARGAVNMRDLLAVELNARIINDNVLGSNLLLQGIAGQNVKILLDGVPLVSGEANEFDLNQLNLNNIEKVEVIEGPLSIQYGTNALAGTINLISKNVPEGKKVLAGLNGYYETVGQYNIDGNVGTVWKGNKVYVSGGRNQFDGFSSTHAVRNKNWNPARQYFGNARTSRRVGELNAGVDYHYFLEDSKSLGDPDLSTQGKTATDNIFTSTRHTANLYLNGKLRENTYLDVINGLTTYSRRSDKYLVNVKDESRKRQETSTTGFATFIFRGALSRAELFGPNTGIQAGYDINLSHSNGDRVSGEATGITDIGIYTSAHLAPFSWLEIQPGLRYAYNNQYDTRALNFLNADLPLIPSINLKFAAAAGTTIRLSYARGFRAPSQRELYWYFNDVNHYIVGNPDLGPELSHNVIASARIVKHAGAVTYILNPFLFYNDIENKIELVEQDRSTVPVDQQSKNVVRTYANIPEFRTMGGNISLGISWGKLTLKPGAGLLARSGSNSQDKKFYSLEVNLQTAYTLAPIDTRISLFYKYNGPMAQFSIEDGELKDRTLQDYHTLDLSLSRAFLNNALQVTAGVKNLFNVTDVAQTGEGSEGLVVRSGFKQALPIAWGTTGFVKLAYTF